MSVTVQVPLSALSDPEVARCLEALFQALSGQSFESTSRRRSVKSRRAARPPAPTGPRPDAEVRYASFMEALPERSREFLELVRERGELGIDDAMRELDVERGKAMGGLTGSIARWAPEHDVTVPFEAVKGADGKRAWRWIGYDVEPAPPVPVRARRRRRGRPAAARPVMRREAATFEQRVEALKKGLPEDTRRFLDLVEEKGEVEQDAVLDHFGLARAQGLKRILRPLDEVSREQGFEDVVNTVVAPTGQRAWRWGKPAEKKAGESGSQMPGAAANRPGVRVRKRSANG